MISSTRKIISAASAADTSTFANRPYVRRSDEEYDSSRAEMKPTLEGERYALLEEPTPHDAARAMLHLFEVTETGLVVG